ncbi:MAG: ATP-binding protein [Firmicutes bacterium]|nr:ATP-binding protein [Bacillota bacterium]
MGKTYLACALGNTACRQGLSAHYFWLPRLLSDLAIARGDGSYSCFLRQLARTDLLFLDEYWLPRSPKVKLENCEASPT